MLIERQTANSAWITLLHAILTDGAITQPRNLRIKELIAVQTSFPMRYPVVTIGKRKLSTKFMAGEAWWIMDGRDDVKSIAQYNTRISQFSDNGSTFFGAYGPKIKEQLDYVVSKLVQDTDTRQCFVNIWRENPGLTRDVPCTTGVQWLIRDGKIHCIDNMRSSDAWLGWPYDVFNFSMMSAYIALLYRAITGVTVELGQLYMNLGSSHLYEPNWASADECYNVCDTYADIPAFHVGDWSSADHLKAYLKLIADRDFEQAQSISQWLSSVKFGNPSTIK